MDYEKALECEVALNELAKKKLKGVDVSVLIETFIPIIENEKTKQRKKELKLNTTSHRYNANAAIQQIVNNFSYALKYSENAIEDNKVLEDHTQDIMHLLELYEGDINDLHSYTEKLAQIRKERRKNKELIELTKPIVRFLQVHKTILKDLGKLHSDIRHIEKVQSERLYEPRVNPEMYEMINGEKPAAEVESEKVEQAS